MTFYLCVSGCGRYLAPRDGHERCFACLGLAHAEAAFVDESCTHCGMMTISELRSRLQLLQRGGVPVPLPRSNPPQRVAASGDTGDLRITVSAFPSGNQPPRKPHSSCTPQPAELPEEHGGPSQRCAQSVSFGAPLDDRMSIAASEGESDLAGDDALAQLPPSGTVAVPDTDPEMMAMLSRAANRVGLVWNPPPCPEPSRLDDWFLGVARAGSQPPTPVPFFPEVHEELTGTWKAPFTARNCASGPSSLTTLDGGAAKGYTRIPPVERAVAMQLCPNSTWRGEPSLPSRACKHSSDLTGRAYQACGEAASALHAMALLQVHQAKALRDLHEVSRPTWPTSSSRTSSCDGPRASGDEGYGTGSGPCDVHSGGPGTPLPQAVSGVWTGPQRHWHINCLELLAVYLALGRLKRPLRGKHVLVRTDNTATVAYINHLGGLRSRRKSQLARHLLWSQKHLRSLCAIHIPGVLNRVADELSRAALPGEWRLHPQVVQLIWGEFGEAQVDLFASLGTSHCQLFYSLSGGTLGTDALAHSWPRGLRKYAFPPVSLLAQTLCKVREDEERVLLVAPYWPNRTWFPELMLPATAPPWLVPLRKDLLSQRRGTLWHPHPDLWKLHVWSLDGTRRY